MRTSSDRQEASNGGLGTSKKCMLGTEMLTFLFRTSFLHTTRQSASFPLRSTR